MQKLCKIEDKEFEDNESMEDAQIIDDNMQTTVVLEDEESLSSSRMEQ
jgi:hypothetical protein